MQAVKKRPNLGFTQKMYLEMKRAVFNFNTPCSYVRECSEIVLSNTVDKYLKFCFNISSEYTSHIIISTFSDASCYCITISGRDRVTDLLAERNGSDRQRNVWLRRHPDSIKNRRLPPFDQAWRDISVAEYSKTSTHCRHGCCQLAAIILYFIPSVDMFPREFTN